MQEIWKDIKDFEGVYQVSNLGNVKSVGRYISAGVGANHQYQYINEKILRLNGGGKYVQVVLSKDGKTYGRLVHRLVAQAFIPNPNNLPCVNHKDENPKNNCVNNLEWCTYKYNNEYNGRVDKCRHKISATLTGRKSTHTLTAEQRRHISEGAKRGWITRRRRVEKEVLQ